MRLTNYFFPTLKETPADAQIVSHRLMLRAGLVCQASRGIYSWLPMGLKVLRKIERIIEEEQNAVGCHQVLMPTVQDAQLWRESGRYDAYGAEMLRFQDRHDREMLYGPTNEEQITDIFRQYVKSYKNLPLNLYQIQWKFRDEIRPRFGVMRGREFLMKDGYSFDLDKDSAVESYRTIFKAYLKTFHRMGLTAIAVKADTGAIGGDMSHEFQIVADTGESEIFYDAALDDLRDSGEFDLDKLLGIYAVASEKHDAQNCPVPEDRLRTSRGIEVGHIFYFGTKYSQSLGAFVMGPDGKQHIPEMGSYGIGVSRLVGAIVEASHDDKGIVWPDAVAPFDVGLLNLKVRDDKAVALADSVYQALQAQGLDALYDDRDERTGVKFADMDLIGLPWQLVVGNNSLQTGNFELRRRKTGETFDVSLEQAIAMMKKSER